MQIEGAVIVNGVQYVDNDIASLLGRDITGWKVAGDIDQEEGSIVITPDVGNPLYFYNTDFDMLRRALNIIGFFHRDPFIG